MAKTKSEPVTIKPAAPAAVTRKYAAGKIVAVAQDVYTDIIHKNARPTMRFPIRSLIIRLSRLMPTSWDIPEHISPKLYPQAVFVGIIVA